MYIPCMTYREMVDNHFAPNGYTVETPQQQDFWGDHDRIMIKKGDYSFPFQYREKYFYLQVVILFRQLEIPIPEDHQKCFDQHLALRKSKIEASQIEIDKKDRESGK